MFRMSKHKLAVAYNTTKKLHTTLLRMLGSSMSIFDNRLLTIFNIYETRFCMSRGIWSLDNISSLCSKTPCRYYKACEFAAGNNCKMN